MSSSSCLPTPTVSSSRYVLSAASQLAVPAPTSFVQRNGTRLELDGKEFRVTGPNVYWLGLDENVDPSPSYPSKSRVLEAMAIASAMGATTIRSTSLGVSFGNALSVENALRTFKSNGSAAWDAIDFAVYAARSYGMRLVLPLTDQYDYYHGGIPTFLRWRNLSSSDYSPFYDLSSDVYQDFRQYVTNLLTHISPYTNLTLATDPTILAFETGNELGGWTGHDYAPPVEWSIAISQYLKELAPQTLVVSGTYGVKTNELGIETVDIHSNHFYPPYKSNLASSASLAHSHSKAFLAGEYDWTNHYYATYRWAYFVLLLPAVLAIAVWLMPKRWWPWSTTLRDLGTCGCFCRTRRRRKRQRPNDDGYDRTAGEEATALTSYPNQKSSNSLAGSAFPSSSPILSSSSATPSHRPRPLLIDRPILIRRWHFSLFLLLLALPIFGIIYSYLPTPISTFLSALTSDTTSSAPSAVGDLYWSLFGKDDSCCAYVQHHDGYTLHYPSDPSSSASSAAQGSGHAVAMLTRHAWQVRGVQPYWAASGLDVNKLTLEDLPVVACPQEGLPLANGTVVGGLHL
ncbi:hypothetical protein JCM21900_002027 [Sporobolomyces salmonicolor]